MPNWQPLSVLYTYSQNLGPQQQQQSSFKSSSKLQVVREAHTMTVCIDLPITQSCDILTVASSHEVMFNLKVTAGIITNSCKDPMLDWPFIQYFSVD